MILLLVLISGGFQGAPQTGDKVVEFARSKLGQKVGDGQCTALATEALRFAGVAPPGRGDVSWGEEREGLAHARPGDILIFDNVVLVQRRSLPDGNVARLTLRSRHHAAIVGRVDGRGREARMTVFHQNSGFDGADEKDRKVVQQWIFSVSELKRGTIKAYHPIASTSPQ